MSRVCRGDGGKEKRTEMEEEKKKRAGLAAAAAVTAILALCLWGYFGWYKGAQPQVDSLIMLDVNPSLSLYVDTKETVLSAEALNRDAREILGNMELEGASLEVAVNAIIGSMLQKGYLSELQNTILVSVENQDAARGAQLQQEVAAMIADFFAGDTDGMAVWSQTVHVSGTETEQLAKQYEISPGKAALIQEVMEQDATLTFDSLAPLSIHEIALISESRNLTVSTVTQTGRAGEKEYIGEEEAVKYACAHLGVAVSDVELTRISFDGGQAVYQVEFAAAGLDYVYEIDAVTGTVQRYEHSGALAAAARETETAETVEEETTAEIETTEPAETTAGPKAETQPPTESETPEETQAPAEPETQEETPAPAQPETPAETPAPTEPETQPEPETQEPAPAEPETQPETEAVQDPAEYNTQAPGYQQNDYRDDSWGYGHGCGNRGHHGRHHNDRHCYPCGYEDCPICYPS